ncbi:MAG: InlB B-repeat-containing protein, partial [Firmicutes bacterium]|nr:InlB B-repeat-containing protein [Bacillota bacterium]
MKKRIFKKLIILLTVAVATMLSVFALTACNRSETNCPIADEFTVTYIATSGGTIQGNSEQVVRYGESASVVTAVPNAGFEFVRWSDDLTTPSRLDQNITARIIMIAEFGRQKETPPLYIYHDVIYVAGTGGTIQGETQQLIRENQEATEVKAVANFGFRFVRWSDGIETTIRHDKNITERLVVIAEFEKIQEPPPPPYTYHAVTYFAFANGTIEGNAEQTIRQGYNATPVTAIPDTGFVFSRWSDGYLNATRHDTNIQARLTVFAMFDFKIFTVEYLATYGGHIWGESPQGVAFGHYSQTVFAMPETGFIFVEWCDGRQEFYRYDHIIANLTRTAHFKRIFYGEGTPYDPFQIRTHQDLMNMRLFPSNFFVLMNDIDLYGINHVPIFD